ncbi:uncharacterized protein MELLADRAFT_62088 [Melampsora larici-populina 98AG31]|uniref:CxC1-like cysteine cluster associated with KDZ transposases domain-containing protein n=1 Tax=Melampsora larici-populina (strain 98AG31 / pathotype 3-4-7) TaxID=747676 RepID=F4RHD5_MELLP|nr:uncharacterized protein MELLADRAFT_62088 [Melampsora larici-populina 98AG31]EGG08267.1 hypothetical protein MELLADRAFT_62088 [Melampsora larici-populina 98AG31]
MPSLRIIKGKGVNNRSKEPKPTTPLQRQLVQNRKRDLEHAEASHAALTNMLNQEQEARQHPGEMLAENIPAGPDPLDDVGEVEDDIDVNRFMLAGEPPENFGDVDDPILAALRRETHLADCLAHEKQWSWQYAIMLPTFLRARLETSNWGNQLKWNEDLRPPCNCTMRTERDVDLVDLLCELGTMGAGAILAGPLFHIHTPN